MTATDLAAAALQRLAHVEPRKLGYPGLLAFEVHQAARLAGVTDHALLATALQEAEAALPALRERRP